MGSRGHGGFAGLLLGSVSAYVIVHAFCLVLVIRDQEPVLPRRSRPRSPWAMWLNHDPNASIALLVGFIGLAAAGTVFAYFLYQPLFRRTGLARPADGIQHGA